MQSRDDLLSPLKVACVIDPSIDRASSDLIRYEQTRDPALIRALPGEKLILFNIRPLTTIQFTDYVEIQTSVAARYRAAFQCAIDSIEGIEPSGQAWKPTGMVHDEEAGGPISVVLATELPYLRKLGVGYKYIYEIGHLVCERAMLEGKVFGGGAHFTLPPTSLAELTRIARLIAVASRTLQEGESTERSASEAQQSSAES